MKFIHKKLSGKEQARLEHAKRVASVSDCNYKHGAVGELGGRVVGVGVNTYRTQKNLFDIVPETGRSVHAEEACLRAMGDNTHGSVMYVARVNRLGEERPSRPCERCTILLKEAGVKKVVYTIDSSLVLD